MSLIKDIILVISYCRIDRFILLALSSLNHAPRFLLLQLLLLPDDVLSSAVRRHTRELRLDHTNLSKISITECELRNQTNIDVSTGISSLHSDESSISAHQADQTYPIIHSSALDIGRSDSMNTFSNCCLESKRFINNWNIVIDCLRNTHYTYLQLSLFYLFRKDSNSSMSSVTSNYI